MNRSRAPGLWPALLSAAIVLGVWLHSVSLRAPWFGIVSKGHHQWLTHSTLAMARNWWEAGALRSGFVMMEAPRSIELPAIADRCPYASYPPGAVFPIHALAVLSGTAPSLATIMGYNAASQAAVALLLVALVFHALRSCPSWMRLAGAILAGCSYVLLPGPMYWHQNVYFADQAVMLPFAAAVTLEVLRPCLRQRSGRGLDIVDFALLLWACATEWLGFCLCATLMLTRWRTGQPRARVVAPGIAAACVGMLWLGQAWASGAFAGMARSFLARTGVSPAEWDNAQMFLPRMFEISLRQYGPAAPPLLAICLILPLVVFRLLRSTQDHRRGLAMAIFLLSVPPTMHLLLLRQHFAIHDFGLLMFTPMFVCVPFLLAPALLVQRADGLQPTMGRSGLAFAAWIFGAVHLIFAHLTWAGMFSRQRVEDLDIASFLRASTSWRDVVYSPSVEIQHRPPYLVTTSWKLVHRIDALEQSRALLDPIAGQDYRVNVLLTGAPGCRSQEERILQSWPFRQEPGPRGWTLLRAERDEWTAWIRQHPDLYRQNICSPDTGSSAS